MEKFYSACVDGKTDDARELLNNLNISEDELNYVGLWGIIIACTYGHGRVYPMFGKIEYTGQWLTKKFKPNAKCLHHSFLESRKEVEQNNKLAYLKPKNFKQAKYNVCLTDLSSCLLEESKSEEILFRPEIKEQYDRFVKLYKSKFATGPFSCTIDEIFKYVEQKPSGFENRSWKIVEQSNRTDIKSCDEDDQHFYKFPKNIYRKNSYDSHYLRVPYGHKLRKIVEEYDLNKIKIVEESLIYFGNKESTLELNDDALYKFVVKSRIESIMTIDKTVVFIHNLSVAEQTDMAHQICQLRCLSGLSDVSLDNLRIDNLSKKIIIVDTEPLDGIRGCFPKCLPILHEVTCVYKSELL